MAVIVQAEHIDARIMKISKRVSFDAALAAVDAAAAAAEQQHQQPAGHINVPAHKAPVQLGRWR